MKTKTNCWSLLDTLKTAIVVAHLDKQPLPFTRLLLIGPPGTGKSMFSKTLADSLGFSFNVVTAFGQMMADEFMGSQTLEESASGGVITGARDSEPLRCMKSGNSVLLIDELNIASEDSVGLLHGILDDRAHVKNAKGETVYASPGFIVVATMNALPDALTPAILDRFDAVIKVGEANPEIFTANAYTPEQRRYLENSYRTVEADWKWSAPVYGRTMSAYVRLARVLGNEIAAQVTMGDMWQEFLSQLASGQ